MPQQEEAVVYDILQHHEFSFLLLVPLRELLEHVVAPYELPNYLLAICPAAPQLLREVDLADVVASEGSDRPLAVLLCEAVLEDS